MQPDWFSIWALIPDGGYIRPTSSPLVVLIYQPAFGEYVTCRWRSGSQTWELESLVIELEPVA